MNTACATPGQSLASIDLDAGFWRPSRTSSDVQACPYDTCAGGAAAAAHYDAASTASCRPGRGLAGVFCQLCAAGAGHYFDAGDKRCKACAGPPLRLLWGLASGAVGAVLLFVVVRWWLRSRRLERWRLMMGALRRIARFLRSASPSIKIVLSFLQVLVTLGEVDCESRTRNLLARAHPAEQEIDASHRAAGLRRAARHLMPNLIALPSPHMN